MPARYAVSRRKTRLVDCNPRWIVNGRFTQHADGVAAGVHFDCPEGHEGCSHAIPFTPALDGTPAPGWQQNGAIWQRTGDTFETLSLSPSIRRIQRYADKAAALAAGCIEQYITESLFCAFHGFVVNGEITFCGDSK